MENEVITIVYDDTPVEHYPLKTQQERQVSGHLTKAEVNWNGVKASTSVRNSPGKHWALLKADLRVNMLRSVAEISFPRLPSPALYFGLNPATLPVTDDWE